MSSAKTWVRDMERDAVAVAFPDWGWRDDDVVIIDQQWTEAGGYSEYTAWDASFETSIEVRRADDTNDQGWDEDRNRRQSYTGDEAAQFWSELMAKGSKHD